MGFFGRPTPTPTPTTFTFDRNDKDYLKYGPNYVLLSKLNEFFFAEQALRELTQREEWLHQKVIALEKAMAIESSGKSDAIQFENANKQLKEIQAQYPRKEYDLYRAEYRFHSIFKNALDTLRRDPKWFMREEMVQDCFDRGGCCSRECGCCEQRHLSKRKKGRGHCTVECGCCISFRGFELPENQKKEMSIDFETMLEEFKPAYAVHLANCFFCPLELKPQPQLSWWKRTLKRGSTDEKH